MALEEEPVPALNRFASRFAGALRLPEGALRFADWEQALRTATGVSSPAGAGDPAGGSGPGGFGLVVLDELPYLLDGGPAPRSRRFCRCWSMTAGNGPARRGASSCAGLLWR